MFKTMWGKVRGTRKCAAGEDGFFFIPCS